MMAREIYTFKTIGEAYNEVLECLEIFRNQTGNYHYSPKVVLIFDTGKGYFPSISDEDDKEFSKYRVAATYINGVCYKHHGIYDKTTVH